MVVDFTAVNQHDITVFAGHGLVACGCEVKNSESPVTQCNIHIYIMAFIIRAPMGQCIGHGSDMAMGDGFPI